MQRGLHFAIVDEVDSILIDEARTPLIISGQAEDNTELYLRMNEIVPKLTRQKEEKGPGDYYVDEKNHQVLLPRRATRRPRSPAREGRGCCRANEPVRPGEHLAHAPPERGAARARALPPRPAIRRAERRSHHRRRVHRPPDARPRWSDGLHQAVEAKEGVQIQGENQTLASITFQNYFRMYKKLAGMTGTADTEAYEFQQIYGLEVVVIPTHMTMIREDRRTSSIRTRRSSTRSSRTSRTATSAAAGAGRHHVDRELGTALRDARRRSSPHQVLNAKQHEREAQIVAQAGSPKMITIATNMAGRGTDIVLGGNLESLKSTRRRSDDDPRTRRARIQKCAASGRHEHDKVVAGGLHIVGTERHESRRIDNQLRGRSGRQGDPGSSRFYLSLEDRSCASSVAIASTASCAC